MRIMEHYGFCRMADNCSGLAFGELSVFISDIEFPYRFSYEKERIFFTNLSSLPTSLIQKTPTFYLKKISVLSYLNTLQLYYSSMLPQT